MPTINAKKLRLAADAATLNAPQDLLTGLTPAFFRGNDLQVDFALFYGAVLQNTTNIASVTLEVKPSDDDYTPPEPGTTPVMTKTLTGASLQNGLTLTDWQDGIAQHGSFLFSANEANLTPGPHWMSLWLLTNDNPGKVITVAAGPLRVLEDGASGSVQAPPPPASSYYTSAQADSRYLQQGQNLADLANQALARTNLGLGSAATANTGTSSGQVPLLGAGGLLSSSVLPPVEVSTLMPRGGIMLQGGWASLPALVIGRSDFDFLFLIKREMLGTEQYLLGAASSGLSLRLSASDKLRVALAGVGDILESSTTLATDAPTWVRLTRGGGLLKLFVNSTEVGSLADALNYTGAIDTLCAQNASGANAFRGTLLAAVAWNRALDEGTNAEYRALGSAELADRWGSMTNIWNATSLTVGKRVYLKTNGTEAITINGTVYRDGTSGSVNATAGVEISIASATVTNTLTAASTLRYTGVLWDVDCAAGSGYQLHDRSGNAAHALLSETGWEHSQKKRDWQLTATLTAAGYLGGAARAVLPPGHILGRVYTVGGSGITISLGEAPGGTQLVASHSATAGVAQATLAGLRSSNSRVYVNYLSGTGSLTLLLSGRVE